MILVDAGPLVALIHRDDESHETCKATLKRIHEPLVTVMPALVEAMYLLGFSWRAQDALWEMTMTDAVSTASLDPGDYGRMRELMDKYRDLPMDLADAALLRVAEREGIDTIFTLDRRDFSIYRTARNRRLRIIP